MVLFSIRAEHPALLWTSPLHLWLTEERSFWIFQSPSKQGNYFLCHLVRSWLPPSMIPARRGDGCWAWERGQYPTACWWEEAASAGPLTLSMGQEQLPLPSLQPFQESFRAGAAAEAASADKSLSCFCVHVSGALSWSTPACLHSDLPKGLSSSNPKPLSLRWSRMFAPFQVP